MKPQKIIDRVGNRRVATTYDLCWRSGHAMRIDTFDGTPIITNTKISIRPDEHPTTAMQRHNICPWSHVVLLDGFCS